MRKIQSLLNQVEFLLASGLGDPSRLNHIKNSILEKKNIYNSDIEYVKTLYNNHLTNFESSELELNKTTSTITCLKCGSTILNESNFCSFCGVPQQKYFDDEIFSSRFRSGTFPFRFRFGINLYQLLTILGGLAALIPSLIAVYSIDRILFSLEYYTGRDLTMYTNLFEAAGVTTALLCIFLIIISFIIKKPKQVGRILFFISFPILIISLGVGVVGFALILLAGIIALQRRNY